MKSGKVLLTVFLACALHHSYAQDSLKLKRLDGLYTAFNIGTWFPERRNKILSHPFVFGLGCEFKNAKNTYGLSFDLVGIFIGLTRSPLNIRYRDTVITTNEYFGALIGGDYSRELISSQTNSIEAMLGMGYGELTYYNPDKDTHIDKGSLMVNPGIKFRQILGKKEFLQIRLQYCLANFDLRNIINADLKGNYFLLKVMIGSHR